MILRMRHILRQCRGLIELLWGCGGHLLVLDMLLMRLWRRVILLSLQRRNCALMLVVVCRLCRLIMLRMMLLLLRRVSQPRRSRSLRCAGLSKALVYLHQVWYHRVTKVGRPERRRSS